ncbi:sulfotransferase family protein [Patiriisocius hiemis]|uniref:Sulfotransferase n=1 Tax=Patiriisocius hiemis TaxID=3075604 RepID=A0ABU2YBE0_9FLAO|nr:sulfotransferase [Constantimarinum sp. W242]MDT0555514.1 sulfotransferase [Constantimarinum sp. W242]
MSLKIIGAGFPRTGTTTLKMALEILGYSKTYHFKDLFANPEQVKYWNELEKNGATDYKSLFDGFQASVDFPGYPYYKKLLKEFPDAKIILTKRDVNAWYESTFKTIWQVTPDKLLEGIKDESELASNENLKNKIACIRFLREVYFKKELNDDFLNKENTIKAFENHIQEVINFLPKEKLLVYEVSQGWGPLCSFLGKPIPTNEFPHLNKKEQFKKMLGAMVTG